MKLGTAIPVTRVSNVMERLYLINKLAKFQDAIAIVVLGVLRTGAGNLYKVSGCHRFEYSCKNMIYTPSL